MVNKQWMKGRFWAQRGLFVKPSPIDPSENLDKYGFRDNKMDEKYFKHCLAELIKTNNCWIHSSHYLTRWRFIDSF